MRSPSNAKSSAAGSSLFTFAKSQARVDRPTQSLFSKAFRGELVPQDPNDEPAAELLSRLRNRH